MGTVIIPILAMQKLNVIVSISQPPSKIPRNVALKPRVLSISF